MFLPEGALRVEAYGKPVDMDKSYDGFCALVRGSRTRGVVADKPIRAGVGLRAFEAPCAVGVPH
jgi:hypothetical protein